MPREDAFRKNKKTYTKNINKKRNTKQVEMKNWVVIL